MPGDRESERKKAGVEGERCTRGEGDVESGECGDLSRLSCTIGTDGVDERLDSFLSRRCAERSRNYFQKLIRDGFALVNGRIVKPGYELRPADVISVRVPEEEAVGDILTPQPMPLEILYEDDDILVLAKAVGIVVHPGAGNEEGTLVHGVLARCPRLASQGAPRRPGIVHRLDRDTSGALVIAKTELAYLSLIEQFKGHEVRKEYVALVYGRMPERSGEVRTLMGRHPVHRKKMAVLEKGGREAVTLWMVEREWQELSLLKVNIETGRTHQIRVHLSHLQHPVAGDEVYGGGKRRARLLHSKSMQDLLLQVSRQMLHARHLAFRHPRTNRELSFTAPLPADFADLIDGIDRIDSRDRA